MTIFDFLAYGIIIYFVVKSALNGLIGEIFSILGWFIALGFARVFAPIVSQTLLSAIEPSSLSMVISFIALIAACKLALAVISRLMSSLLNSIHLGSINLILGSFIGLIKGVLLVSFIVLICLLFSDLPQEDYWQNAYSAPFFEACARLFIPYLPEFLAQKLS